MKGAAGQAIQNMNLILGCDETAGLLVKVLIKLGGTLLDAPESRRRLAARDLRSRQCRARKPSSFTAAASK